MSAKPTDKSLDQRIRQLEKENARLNKTNQELSRTISRVKSFLENVDDSVLICDRKAKPMTWNSAYEKIMNDIFRVKMESAPGPYQCLPGKEENDLRNIVHEQVLFGKQFKAEYTPASSNNEVSEENKASEENNVRYLEITYSPIYDSNHIAGFSVLIRDITKQKLAEEKLSIFKKAVDASADAIGISTARGKHYYQNASFNDLFGDIGNDPPSTLYADEKIGREIFATITGGSPWIGEVEMHGKDGKILIIFLRAYPVKDNEGKVRRLVGVHTNITKQKQAENELRTHREHLQELVTERTLELRESEARFRQISDNINDVFYLCSDDYTNVYYVSPGFEKTWGKNVAELYKNPWVFLESIHDDDRHRVEEHKKKILNTHDFMDTAIEYRIINTEGSIRWIRDEMVPVYDLNCNLTRIAGSARDITRRKTAEEALRRSGEKSQELSRYLQRAVEDERKRIAREIHDDLGQTLIALKMNMVRCREKLPDNLNPLTEITLNMEKTIDRMIQSIKIMISDLRAGPLADLGLEPAIEWLANTFLKDTGRDIKIELNTEPVDLDPNRSMALFRIAQETLTNIIRHSDAAAVTVNMFVKNDHAVLRISDNGSGIPDTRALPDSSYGIMGMKERARFFKGDLLIESNTGKGVTITASIPVKD